jgi:hypothetical protein
VLILTYHGTSVRELSYKEAKLREQIWADYLQRMVSRKGDVKRYPLHVTITWLGWLARQMRQRNQTIFYLEQLQPDWLPKRRRAIYGWSVGLVLGLLFGLSLGLSSGQIFGLSGGLGVGLFFGLGIGLLVGLSKAEPAKALTWSWEKERSGLLVGLLVGLLSGLIFGLSGGMLAELLFGLAAAVQHYILRFWLSCTHTFPWKAMPFLDDATTHTLQRVGGGYSFIHHLLLDYFADLDTQASPTSTAVSST